MSWMPARFWQVLITSMTMRISSDKQRSVTPANTEKTYDSHWDFLAAPQKARNRALLFYLGFVLFRDENTLNKNGRNQMMQFFTLVSKRLFNKKKKLKTIFLFFNTIVLWYTAIPASEIHCFQSTSFLVWEHQFKMKTSHECNCVPDVKAGTESE